LAEPLDGFGASLAFAERPVIVASKSEVVALRPEPLSDTTCDGNPAGPVNKHVRHRGLDPRIYTYV